MTAILYTSKTCGPCRMTKQLLAKFGVDYEERDTEDPDNMAEAFRLSGLSIVPVVVYNDTVVSGYRPQDLIKLFRNNRVPQTN